MQHAPRLPGRSWRLALVLAPGLIAAVVLACHAPIGQNPHFHAFADRRTWLGIPHAGDVLTNLPFFAVGVWGLIATWCQARFVDAWERWPWTVVFAGLVLTAIGSGWYHWDPSNGSLFWDRLPLTFVFMGLFTAVLGERLGIAVAKQWLVPLCIAGPATVVYWGIGEQAYVGAGDLRPYGLVQFYPMVALPLLLLLFPPRYDRGWMLGGVLAAYGAAKLLELFDHEIFHLLAFATGHNLKHVVAAGALGLAAWWLMRRKPIGAGGQIAASTSTGAA